MSRRQSYETRLHGALALETVVGDEHLIHYLNSLAAQPNIEALVLVTIDVDGVAPFQVADVGGDDHVPSWRHIVEQIIAVGVALRADRAIGEGDGGKRHRFAVRFVADETADTARPGQRGP